MKIKTKYYYAEKGGYQTSNQYMILKDRYIIGLENQLNSTENGKPFSSVLCQLLSTLYALDKSSEWRVQKIAR